MERERMLKKELMKGLFYKLFEKLLKREKIEEGGNAAPK